MNIAKGKIGNALTSVADDHVVAVTVDVYDEYSERYQANINVGVAQAEEYSDYLFYVLTDASGVTVNGNVVSPADGVIMAHCVPQSLKVGGNATFFSLEYMESGQLSDIAGMFGGCSNLQSVSLTTIDTEGISCFDEMFGGCGSLTSVDLSSFDFTNAVTFKNMFSGDSALTSVVLPKMRKNRIRSIAGMFDGCVSLSDLNIHDVDLSSLTDMANAFRNCRSLRTFDVTNTSCVLNVIDAHGMFLGCSGLQGISMQRFDTTNAVDLSGMFAGCSGVTAISFDESFFKAKLDEIPLDGLINWTDTATLRAMVTALPVLDADVKRKLVVSRNTMNALYAAGLNGTVTAKNWILAL